MILYWWSKISKWKHLRVGKWYTFRHSVTDPLKSYFRLCFQSILKNSVVEPCSLWEEIISSTGSFQHSPITLWGKRLMTRHTAKTGSKTKIAQKKALEELLFPLQFWWKAFFPLVVSVPNRVSSHPGQTHWWKSLRRMLLPSLCTEVKCQVH